MVADRFERYAVSDGPGELHIELRQGLQCVGCGVLTLLILAAGWSSTAPFSVGWWAWTGPCAVAGALIVMSALWEEDWWISTGDIRYENSFRYKERLAQGSPGEPIILRVEVLPRDPDSDGGPSFPHGVRLFGPDEVQVGWGFWFQRRSNLDRFVETLRCALPVEVEEQRSQKESASKPPIAPEAMSDPWLD